MVWYPVFETDRDSVRSTSVAVTKVSLAGNVATITTESAHYFEIGWFVTLLDVDEPFAGTFRIETIPSSTTFTYSVLSPDISETNLSPYGTAISPSESYVRYDPNDAVLDNIASLATFYAEPWDYNTVRLVWGVDPTLEAKALDDISNGYTPKVVITRSAFGSPATPLDGVKILDRDYVQVMASVNRSDVVPYFETQRADSGNDFNRPALPVQGLYDRNLPSGRWYYYSLFFYLKGDDADPEWRLAGNVEALTPVNHRHAEKLYELLPQYYQAKDQEFVAGTGLGGTVQRLLQVAGFELDYTLSLAEHLEHIYDVDHAHKNLVRQLGESNFGIPSEEGIGEIRYRSLISTISTLYSERGSSSGLKRMTTATTKYRCKLLEGINLLNLTDDAEFAGGTGSWGNPSLGYPGFVAANPWALSTVNGADVNTADISSVGLTTTTTGWSPSPSLVTRRNAMLVEKADPLGSNEDGMLLACGLGTGALPDRRHSTDVLYFEPRKQGVRCQSGIVYTFSMHASLVNLLDPIDSEGAVTVGIMWFNDPENGVFNVDNDYIPDSRDESVPALDINTGVMQRYWVDSQAPLSLRGQPYVFAIPYIVFKNSYPRYVSACMFNEQLNTAAGFAIDLSRFNFLTVGDVNETLDSEFLLGTE